MNHHSAAQPFVPFFIAYLQKSIRERPEIFQAAKQRENRDLTNRRVSLINLLLLTIIEIFQKDEKSYRKQLSESDLKIRSVRYDPSFLAAVLLNLRTFFKMHLQKSKGCQNNRQTLYYN